LPPSTNFSSTKPTQDVLELQRLIVGKLLSLLDELLYADVATRKPFEQIEYTVLRNSSLPHNDLDLIAARVV
jgi:hypothetical protein